MVGVLISLFYFFTSCGFSKPAEMQKLPLTFANTHITFF